LLLIIVEIFFFLSTYIALSNWIWKIYHIDIILQPKLCQFVQFEISPSMSHKVFIFLIITHIKNQMDFNKHDLAIFLCDMWQKYSKCKVTSTKAKSTFPRQLLLPNGPVAWSLVYSIHSKKWNITHNPLQMDWQMSQILQNLPNDVFYPLDKFLWSH
jgi:hypothetical protein